MFLGFSAPNHFLTRNQLLLHHFREQLDLKTALGLYSNLSVEALQQLSYLLTSSAMSFKMTAVCVLQRGQVGGLTEALVTAQGHPRIPR